MGFSEGAQVAASVAAINKKVTHVVCFGGNSLNHFYDFIIEARLKAQKGDISHDESQKIVDSLYNEYKQIYADPKSTTKGWYGETNLKWSSFCKTTPLESLLQLDIPILYIAGAKDNNQTIIDTDYAYLEFLRMGKTNFTYKVYPNCDHFFREEEIINGERKSVNRIKEVHQFALDWVTSQKK
jgi:pimeloyl-ACP methyl ester carboxylesterase